MGMFHLSSPPPFMCNLKQSTNRSFQWFLFQVGMVPEVFKYRGTLYFPLYAIKTACVSVSGSFVYIEPVVNVFRVVE